MRQVNKTKDLSFLSKLLEDVVRVENLDKFKYLMGCRV